MSKVKPLCITRDLKGNVITLLDLPEPTTRRWTPNKKAIVVRAVDSRIISLQEALTRYNLTESEFNFWRSGLEEFGVAGLKLTYFQKRKVTGRSG